MFILLSIVYFLESVEIWEKVLILILMLLLVATHFLIFTNFGIKYMMRLTWVDVLISAVIGFVYGDKDALYLIYFGIIAVTIFIRTNDRAVLIRFSISFFIIWIGIMLINYIRTEEFSFWSNIVSFSFVVFGSIVGQLIRKLMETQDTVEIQYKQLEESHVALTDAHEQLRNYSLQVEELTAIRERNRIAREIHDTVGHKMTALLIQMQLAQELMSVDQQQSKVALQKCDQLAREALQEVRLSVRAIQEDDDTRMTLAQTIKKMLHDFSSMTGLEVNLVIEGEVSEIPTSIQPTITRIIQESLTNSKKHGLATKCGVTLSYSERAVMLEISDNGYGTGKIVPGFGLVNMRERVVEHGGSLQYKSEQGTGFVVKAEFPLTQLKWSSGGAV
ncbi:sensor histidine kinase [Fredinandcohnia humi]